jgi:MoxR-like ATPase
VRNLMTLLVYAKALAFFRGHSSVSLEDVRQILPFVLHEKLQPDLDAPFFNTAENGPMRTDRIGWLRRVFDLSCAEFDRLDLDRTDPVGDMAAEFAVGLEGLAERDTRGRLEKIERLIATLLQGGKLYGHLHDDLMQLKYLHQRYSNYLRWLKTR